jgi:hypothetical protein
MAAITYQQVKDLRQTVTVAMDQVRFIAFGNDTGKYFLLTADLNSCFGVAIASSTAGILGHIPPRPNSNLDDPFAGDRNVAARMREIAGLVRENRAHFSRYNEVLVVSGIWEGEVALPEQKQIIENSLREMGLSHANVEYSIKGRREPRSDAYGTIVIDGRGSRPLIYVEDQRVGPLLPARHAQAAQSTSQPASTQQPSRHAEAVQSTSQTAPTQQPATHAGAAQSTIRQNTPRYLKSTRATIQGKAGRVIELDGRKFIPDGLWQKVSSNGREMLYNKDTNVVTDA